MTDQQHTTGPRELAARAAYEKMRHRVPSVFVYGPWAQLSEWERDYWRREVAPALAAVARYYAGKADGDREYAKSDECNNPTEWVQMLFRADVFDGVAAELGGGSR